MIKKYDLKDVTFCIPIYIDSVDRKQNLELILRYITNKFNTNIIVGETNNDVPLLEKFCNKKGLDYIYYKNDEKFFYKTKILNLMYLKSKTDYIFAYDCDVLYKDYQYIEAIKKLRFSKFDCCFAYVDTIIDVPRSYYKEVFKTLNLDILNNKIRNFKRTKEDDSPGMGCLMRRDVIIECGMENENFKSWGPEDRERIVRINKLGYRFDRVNKGFAYHIRHFRSVDSSKKNKYFNKNTEEYERIKNISTVLLREEIGGWTWVKGKKKRIPYSKKNIDIPKVKGKNVIISLFQNNNSIKEINLYYKFLKDNLKYDFRFLYVGNCPKGLDFDIEILSLNNVFQKFDDEWKKLYLFNKGMVSNVDFCLNLYRINDDLNSINLNLQELFRLKSEILFFENGFGFKVGYLYHIFRNFLDNKDDILKENKDILDYISKFKNISVIKV